MNNRIREFALKAAESSSWKPGLGNEQVQQYFQAFAELILKNCIDILMQPEHAFAEKAEDLSEYNQGWISGRLLGAEQIKEYFGVNE